MNQQLPRNARSVWWNGHLGHAYCDEVEVAIYAAPRIHGIHALAEVDYSPRVRLYQVREIDGGWRTLTPHECASLDTNLRRMAARARDALC